MSYFFHEPPWDLTVRKFAPLAVASGVAATLAFSPAPRAPAADHFDDIPWTQPARKFAPLAVTPAGQAFGQAARRQAGFAAYVEDDFSQPARRFAPLAVQIQGFSGARRQATVEPFEDDHQASQRRRYAPLAVVVTPPFTSAMRIARWAPIAIAFGDLDDAGWVFHRASWQANGTFIGPSLVQHPILVGGGQVRAASVVAGAGRTVTIPAASRSGKPVK